MKSKSGILDFKKIISIFLKERFSSIKGGKNGNFNKNCGRFIDYRRFKLGLIGLAEFDLVAFLFGPMTGLTRIVYILVGASAIWMLVDWSRHLPVNRS